MGNRLGRLAILIAIAAIVLVGIGATVNAQNDRAVCRDARYDINGDGLFTRVDPNAWKGTFARENCELGSAVARPIRASARAAWTAISSSRALTWIR